MSPPLRFMKVVREPNTINIWCPTRARCNVQPSQGGRFSNNSRYLVLFFCICLGFTISRETQATGIFRCGNHSFGTVLVGMGIWRLCWIRFCSIIKSGVIVWEALNYAGFGVWPERHPYALLTHIKSRLKIVSLKPESTSFIYDNKRSSVRLRPT